MEPTKLVWAKGDTFQSIHEKLKALVGLKVLDTYNNVSKPLDIFSVSDVVKYDGEFLGDGAFKYIGGDMNYCTHSGDYNGKGMKIVPLWRFSVGYGVETKDGLRQMRTQHFDVMRQTEDYSDEVNQKQIVIYHDCAIVHYAIGKQKES